VGVTVQLFGYTIKLPITVQRLQLHTRLRVSAQVRGGQELCNRLTEAVRWCLCCKGTTLGAS